MLDITAFTVATDIQASKNYTYNTPLSNINKCSNVWGILVTVFH